MKKLLKGYKTIIMAALTAAFGAAQVAVPALGQALDAKTIGFATMFIGVVFAVLRTITDTPLGQPK